MTRLRCRPFRSVDGAEKFAVHVEEIDRERPLFHMGAVDSLRRATHHNPLLPPKKRHTWGAGDTAFAMVVVSFIGFILGLAFQPTAMRLFDALDRVLP